MLFSISTGLFGKVRSVTEVLREAWLVSRVPANDLIFQYLGALAEKEAMKASYRGFQRYLQDLPAIGRIEVREDWFYHKASGEMRLTYTNSLFAPGCLRLKEGNGAGPIVVFLPGYYVGADDVLVKTHHPQNMTWLIAELGVRVACWDWPLQGSRRDGCLYRGLRSVKSCEREYSRILPVLGTCLWREEIAELEFAVKQIRRHTGFGCDIYTVGWSMGGFFAYFAPLLGVDLAATIVAGSCARIKDLLAEGKSRLHGYFFYPLNGLAYFDLEDIVGNLFEMEQPLQIICGDRDAGCLASTRRALIDRAVQLGHQLTIEVLPNHGHFFSQAIKGLILRFLSSYQAKLHN